MAYKLIYDIGNGIGFSEFHSLSLEFVAPEIPVDGMSYADMTAGQLESARKQMAGVKLQDEEKYVLYGALVPSGYSTIIKTYHKKDKAFDEFFDIIENGKTNISSHERKVQSIEKREINLGSAPHEGG